ncbi:MAG: TIGR04348 family glycosyltransferase [Gammaproteobacteria bacterium]|nr:TIGR04348 family glycosyltransferase [Gammaproteobacteria bacterium]MDX5374447.1 TIGR04348 family glycosyltransferase [Gammaproteobacteria bacterium]
MHIRLITPAPRGSRAGNRATANRWAAILRRLGHRVHVSTDYQGEPADLMVGLHAWRSAEAIARFAATYPDRPLVVVLTGTDAYRFIHSHPETTLASLEAADHIVGLHALVGNVLPEHLRARLHVIVQSARPLLHRQPARRSFRVCFAGHLREEKDPLRPALAVRDLPPDSRIRVDAYGGAHTPDWAAAAREEMQRNPRYRWHGEIPHAELRRVYARSHLLVLPSIMEGGANVISEAVMAGLPVIASDIDGSVGLLGDDYPGYYPVKNADALRDLLLRAESDPGFYAELEAACSARRDLFMPEREQAGWQKLLEDIEASGPT